MRRLSALLAALVLAAAMLPGGALAQSVAAADWAAYKAAFLDPSGRIVDDANGGISHSEGQGYGMLLAVMAGNRADFDLIWAFTRTELLLRDDGLAAWKWDPHASPHVTDANNATDGDILIAYALASAGELWSDRQLTAAAARIASSIASHALVRHGGHTLILPGVDGFSAKARADGPVVNPSYWIYEAFPALAHLNNDVEWQAVARDGRWLTAAALASARRLPPDWVSLATRARPAKGFPSEFGYNGLRIPLYLIRAGGEGGALLKAIVDGMSVEQNAATVALPSGKVEAVLEDPGYRAVVALARCVTDGARFPDELKVFKPTLYYPSTLHLLVLDHLARHPETCK